MRRSKYDLTKNILELSINGTNKTRIIEGCGLSYEQCIRYLMKLLNADLLRLEQHHSKFYKTTEKGKLYIQKYGELLSLIEK